MFRALIKAKGLPPYADQEFSTAGSSSLTVPDNVEYVSIVCVGGGGGSAGNFAPCGGDGGTLAYGTFKVSAGDVLSVTVGAGGTAGAYTNVASGNAAGNGGDSSVSLSGSTLILAPGGSGGGRTNSATVYFDPDGVNTGSGAGGQGAGTFSRFSSNGPSGGGAGGYGGPGGDGGSSGDGDPGTFGGSGGGGRGNFLPDVRAGNGGGTHLYGLGNNGAGGLGPPVDGGSGGNGSADQGGSSGYGGGAGGCPGANYLGSGFNGSTGRTGGVRIVWPGRSRSFPSQDVNE